jgi:hypothetical protein
LTTKCQRKNGPARKRNHLRGISVLSRYPNRTNRPGKKLHSNTLTPEGDPALKMLASTV